MSVCNEILASIQLQNIGRDRPWAADFADCARLGIGGAKDMTFDGVEGVSSVPLLFRFDALSCIIAEVIGPSSSTTAMISGRPLSMPTKVRSSSSRSRLKRRSFCSSRLSSMYSASSSAICSGVRDSRLATYFLRVVSRSDWRYSWG